MLDKSTATTLRIGQTLYHAWRRGSDRRPIRCRVNGKLKTWKTRPDEFRLPVKYGLNACFYITEHNAHEWRTEECAESI